jgi:hypothetical protein
MTPAVVVAGVAGAVGAETGEVEVVATLVVGVAVTGSPILTPSTAKRKRRVISPSLAIAFPHRDAVMKPLFAAMLTILLGGSTLAGAPSRPAVIDNAKMFSPEVVKRANLLIADIRQEYGIDLCVETMEQLPGLDAAKLASMRTRARGKLLQDTAQERADEAGVDGIFVLVTTNPPNVILVGWPVRRELEDKPLEEGGGLSFTKRDTRMRRPFAAQLANDPDGALLRLVDHFRMVVKERVAPPPSPLETGPAAILIGVMIGLWIVLMILQRAVARRQAAVAGEPCPPLYQPAMLGSLFGVPAGFWVYDRLFRRERPPAGMAVAEPHVPPPPEPPIATEEARSPAEITEEPVPPA